MLSRLCYTALMSTKNMVLEYLRQKNCVVSGEELAQKCCVSRAAIWKAVKALRDQGYDIVGATNGGYVLSQEADVLDEASVRACLKGMSSALSNTHIEVFESIDSTNTYAKRTLSTLGSLRNSSGELTEAGRVYDKAIIAAQSQSAGRGRLGRSFASPAKSGIYMSYIHAPRLGIQKPACITAYAAVAVKRALESLYGVQCSIKWINDIYVNGKKVCGILTEGFTNFETQRTETAIIGIGVNICDNPELFEKAASPIVGSVTGSSDTKLQRSLLVATIADNLFQVFSEDEKLLLDEYRLSSLLTGKTVQVHPIIDMESSYYEAKVIGIDDQAQLVVELSDGQRKALSSGEVSLHGNTSF